MTRSVQTTLTERRKGHKLSCAGSTIKARVFKFYLRVEIDGKKTVAFTRMPMFVCLDCGYEDLTDVTAFIA